MGYSHRDLVRRLGQWRIVSPRWSPGVTHVAVWDAGSLTAETLQTHSGGEELIWLGVVARTLRIARVRDWTRVLMGVGRDARPRVRHPCTRTDHGRPDRVAGRHADVWLWEPCPCHNNALPFPTSPPPPPTRLVQRRVDARTGPRSRGALFGPQIWRYRNESSGQSSAQHFDAPTPMSFAGGMIVTSEGGDGGFFVQGGGGGHGTEKRTPLVTFR